MAFGQHRREWCLAPRIAPRGKRTERVAVVALVPRNDAGALRLPDLDHILPRHFQRGLDGFRPSRDEIDLLDPLWRVFDQPRSEAFSGLIGEETRMRKSQRLTLFGDRGLHIGVRMPQTGHRRASRSVEVTLSVFVDEIASLPAYGTRWRDTRGTVKDTGGCGGC